MKFKGIFIITAVVFFSSFQVKGQTNRHTIEQLENNQKEIFDTNSIQVENEHDVTVKKEFKKIKNKHETKNSIHRIAKLDDTTVEDAPKRSLTINQLEKIVTNSRRRASKGKINSEMEKCFQSLEHESCEE